MTDWPWPVVLLLVLPAAIGHLCHFVLLDQRRERSGLSRTHHGPPAVLHFRGALGLLRRLAAFASERSILELAVAVLRLCDLVRLLGHGGLARGVAVPRAAKTAWGSYGNIEDGRSGAHRRQRGARGRRPAIMAATVARSRFVPALFAGVGSRRAGPRSARSMACKSCSSAIFTSTGRSSGDFSSELSISAAAGALTCFW